MQFRIGNRDPVTGLYDVIWPDGSSTRNGLKVFNSAHQTGDVVLATKRSDGIIVLDRAKAVEPSPPPQITYNPKETPVGYLQGQIWNNEDNPRQEDPLIIKVLPPSASLPLNSERNSFPGFFCTNLERTEIELTPFFNNATLSSTFSATFLDLIPSVVAKIDTSAAHRSRIRMNSQLVAGIQYGEIWYRQVDLQLMKSVCAARGCRYLLVAWANWPFDWTDPAASYGTISIQRGKYLDDTSGYIPFDVAEHSEPYIPNAGLKYGWTNWRWLCQTSDTLSRPFELFFFCLQIDLTNTYNVRWLTPIYTPPAGSDNTLVSQRLQIINP